jgi:hypothetical protein
VAELEALGADAVIVSTEAPIDEQVGDILGRVYGSLTGEPIRVGEDPRDILSGRRTLEVF